MLILKETVLPTTFLKFDSTLIATNRGFEQTPDGNRTQEIVCRIGISCTSMSKGACTRRALMRLSKTFSLKRVAATSHCTASYKCAMRSELFTLYDTFVHFGFLLNGLASTTKQSCRGGPRPESFERTAALVFVRESALGSPEKQTKIYSVCMFDCVLSYLQVLR